MWSKSHPHDTNPVQSRHQIFHVVPRQTRGMVLPPLLCYRQQPQRGPELSPFETFEPFERIAVPFAGPLRRR